MHAVTGIEGAVPVSLADDGTWDQQVARLGPTALLGIADAKRAGSLALAAQQAGFAPTLAFTPAQLLSCLRGNRFDLVVVDPPFIESADSSRGARARESAWGFLETICARSAAPVLVLGPAHPAARPARARGAPAQDEGQGAADVVRGIVALLPDQTCSRGEPGTAVWGPLTLDLSRRQAWWASAPLELTPVQFRVLAVLVAAAGAVVTNGELARRVWGSQGHLDRERIFAHIRRIRKKIEDDPANPRFLLTVRGEGFRLALPPPPH